MDLQFNNEQIKIYLNLLYSFNHECDLHVGSARSYNNYY